MWVFGQDRMVIDDSYVEQDPSPLLAAIAGYHTKNPQPSQAGIA
jgi:hypothetical protein